MTESLHNTRNYQHFICFLAAVLSLSPIPPPLWSFPFAASADPSYCPSSLGNLSFGSLFISTYVILPTPCSCNSTLPQPFIPIFKPQTFVCIYYNSSLKYKHLTLQLLPFVIPVHFFLNTPTPKMIKPH